MAKTIIEAISTYYMMTMDIPKACIQKIHQCQRLFIWGDTNDKTHLHSIKWSILCNSKHFGGIGPRNLKIMNKAYLAKLGWTFKTRQSYLWTSLMTSKYHARHTAFGNLTVKLMIFTSGSPLLS